MSTGIGVEVNVGAGRVVVAMAACSALATLPGRERRHDYSLATLPGRERRHDYSLATLPGHGRHRRHSLAALVPCAGVGFGRRLDSGRARHLRTLRRPTHHRSRCRSRGLSAVQFRQQAGIAQPGQFRRVPCREPVPAGLRELCLGAGPLVAPPLAFGA
ncbi:hypothetical protein AB0H83_21220, partial [Dactylosporangium sp. NPDC050688]|uniref:hypothetical protein n=1 Tax=Dactylosporangium sp. NPDC050688 TaxID=3157217 RepID=UPI0033E5FAD5